MLLAIALCCRGQMTLLTSLVAQMIKNTRALLNLPRTMLSVSGNALRVVELLSECERNSALSDMAATAKATYGGDVDTGGFSFDGD